MRCGLKLSLQVLVSAVCYLCCLLSLLSVISAVCSLVSCLSCGSLVSGLSCLFVGCVLGCLSVCSLSWLFKTEDGRHLPIGPWPQDKKTALVDGQVPWSGCCLSCCSLLSGLSLFVRCVLCLSPLFCLDVSSCFWSLVIAKTSRPKGQSIPEVGQDRRRKAPPHRTLATGQEGHTRGRMGAAVWTLSICDPCVAHSTCEFLISASPFSFSRFQHIVYAASRPFFTKKQGWWMG